MIINEPAYDYWLHNFESNECQTLLFIKKEEVDGELITVQEGTTNEEVLEVLIHRLKILMEKLPSRETALAITNAEQALMWLERRTKNREDQGVEGTHKPHSS